MPFVAVALIAVAVLLIGRHLRSWKEWRVRPMDPLERNYRVGQFRRRTHMAALLAIIGVFMFIAYCIEPQAHPKLFATNAIVLLLVTLWMIGVAIFDAIETGRFFARISRRR
jgi:uncharacterized membrane protein